MLNLASAQWVQDECFNSVSTGADFPSSELLRNTASNHTDIVKYQDGSWAGADGNVVNNLSIVPPVNCDATKAAFFRVTPQDTIGQGIGFRLSSALQQGSSVNIEFTYVSHGYGSQGTFAPKIYSSDNGEFQVNGNITAQFIATLPGVGNEWETHTWSYTPGALTAGHEWIYFYAPVSSGLLVNMCQIESGSFEYSVPLQVDMCEGGSVIIGEEFDPSLDIDYSWSNGSGDATIEVNEGGLYIVEAANQCSQHQESFFVIEHGEPHLNFEEDTLKLCEGEIFNLYAVGLNAQPTWPNGTTDSLFVVSEEGTLIVNITDDCFTIETELEVDYDSIPFIDLGPDTALCLKETLLLDATVPEDVDYLWDNGSTEPTRFVTFENTFEVTLTNDCGSFTDAIFVEYSEPPADILPDVTYACFGRRALLDATSVEGDYVWQDGSTEGTLWTNFSGYYWVRVYDDDGCFTAADTTLVIESQCECHLYIPNAFTPDQDGINDEFGCVFECAPYDYQMLIYNRWGAVVQELTYPAQRWNGKLGGDRVQNGVYGYYVRYRETYDGIPIEITGSVALIGTQR